MAIARTCNCGRRITDGSSRCERCGSGGGRAQSCSVCARRCRGPYCPDHEYIRLEKIEAARLAAQPWRAGYRHKSYHRGRTIARKRANGSCEECGRRDLPLECDHIVSLRNARSMDDVIRLNDPDNLRMLCSGPGSCHERKTLNRG